MNRIDYFNMIESAMVKYIKEDFVFLDLPYFANVGDILIWQASLDLMKELPFKCLYSASSETYIKPHIKSTTPILLMGGGNWGDLWIKHQKFRHRILNDFPKNPIIQLPQSVYFSSMDEMAKDVELFKQHEGPIIICTRDRNSFDFISQNYPFAESVLLPDMVLSLDVNKYLNKNIHSNKKNLFIKRNDSEKIDIDFYEIVPKDADIADWPCMEKNVWQYCIMQRIEGLLKRLPVLNRYQVHLRDFFYKKILKDVYLKSGIELLAQYRTIYSTRLHAGILGFLLGKRVFMIDNSYGKCSGVFDLWMSDQKNVTMIWK